MAEQVAFEDSRLEEQNKVVSLFQFIQELNKLKQKAILDYTEYPWHFTLSNLPNDPDNISTYYRDRVEDESVTSETDGGDILLSVHKPEFQKCPEPDAIFKAWLHPGWDDFLNTVSIRESISSDEEGITAELLGILRDYANDSDTEPTVIHYSDSEERIIAYERWLKQRTAWAEKQKLTARTRSLFTKLYSIYFELQRESETEEIIIANGILCDKNNPAIKHPVLTHRVKLDYNANTNTVFIMDTEVPSELYSIVFQTMDDINLSSINTLNADLQKNDYHPLDRNDTPGFLKILVHQLSSQSVFSTSGIPDHWSDNNRLLLYIEPCYIVRKRLDGTLKAIEQIIENVQATGEIPAPIRDIVSGGKSEIPEDTGEESLEEQLAAVGGESIDILLSKEANKEQLEIARRIENYNAVLVQGPPGTGKTHTIANLMGHFLAQGKSVLVTSHTPKALRVLKEKIEPELQDLCVSMLDDSNVDMERSVDGITSYMSKTNSHELKQEMDRIAEERGEIIRELADVRRKIYAIINQECNCIVYNGEDISPSQAAKFVTEHAEELSYIPGKVRLRAPLPLTFEQLTELYHSNESISVEDEAELANDLPSTEQIISPSDFSFTWDARQRALREIDTFASRMHWTIDNNENERQIRIEGSFGSFSAHYPLEDAVQELKDYARSFGKIEQWMKAAAVDGKKRGNFRQLWITLIDQIQKTNDYAESIMAAHFGVDICFTDTANKRVHKAEFEAIREKNGKIGFWDKLFHKEYVAALEAVTINGKQAQSTKECDMILHCMELDEHRERCASYWDNLLTKHDVPRFYDLDTDNQERIAGNWIPLIQKYLDWYQDAYQPLLDKLAVVGIPSDIIFEVNPLDSEIAATDKILSAIENVIPAICDVFLSAIKAEQYSAAIKKTNSSLLSGKRGDSRVCTAILASIAQGNADAYAEGYADLERMYEKYALQRNRIEMLKTLEPIAHEWAEAIRNRQGIHGQVTVPSNIEDAWKWKQLCGIVEEITEKPFSDLQADSLHLSKEYRRITARYAAKSSWYHLLKRTETNISMRQALQGWKLTVKKIGKGTGKQAPALKATARGLMAQCQSAVPAWIMPINRALESLNPKRNRFDVVIIDEASQSDVSSLAILYMGRKLIIVGDDKQVSPMAVGVNNNQMESLQQMYISGKIPNSNLYDAKTSIYDIAATTFQPLMLREHFRCVPEIIGFSNKLSYNYKINPLRDASSSNLLPAVVNYRVDGGQRDGKNKTNPKEAKAIVALMKACMEQPEYEGKSFGVISLLGNDGDQVKCISQLIEQEIAPKDIKQRDILCGNSAHFQGDERDVIFLSMVDSGGGNGPLSLMGFGTDDAYRKRYNVAASRARDQLWVVDSLDVANDLKPGDLRKMLIDYSINPQASADTNAKVAAQAQSPFEAAVATALVTRGYHLVQQWEVGAYRLDMVAVCGDKKVAIECDGDRWHIQLGAAKIREDMERQTILERIGWRFIRIRGSEYYRNPEKTIERVISELAAYEIEPEEKGVATSEGRDTELLRRVKHRAAIIMGDDDDLSPKTVDETIESALNSKSMVPDNTPQDITLFPMDTTSEGVSLSEMKEKLDSISAPNLRQNESAQQTQETKIAPKPEVKKPVTAPPRTGQPEQMGLPGLENEVSKEEDIIVLLKKYNIQYVDKRPFKGALWILGGGELKPVVEEARKLGFYFTFKKDGGKTIKGKDCWWAK